MVKPNSEDRSPMAVAMEWSVRLTTIGLEMALPAGGGFWLDHSIGTMPVFVILGAILGFIAGFYHLMQIARQESSNKH
jgi:F0F1-type ATP synthase assembly protein I